MIKVMGQSVAWGVKAEWVAAPVINLPPGAVVVKRRMRNMQVMQIFVRNGQALSRHFVELKDNALALLPASGVNHKEARHGMA